MGDMKRLREMDRRNTCLRESAHSVVRQIKVGNLGEVSVVRGSAYSYPVERKPFAEMERDELSEVAVVVAAGIFAEDELYSKIGDQDVAIADDLRQWHGIQQLCGYSDEEMKAFSDEAAELVRDYEYVIRRVALALDCRNKLSGKEVSRLMERYRDRRVDRRRSESFADDANLDDIESTTVP